MLMRYYTNPSSTVSLSLALITSYMGRESALTLCLKVYLDGLLNISHPKDTVKEEAKRGARRAEKSVQRVLTWIVEGGWGV